MGGTWKSSSPAVSDNVPWVFLALHKNCWSWTLSGVPWNRSAILQSQKTESTTFTVEFEKRVSLNLFAIGDPRWCHCLDVGFVSWVKWNTHILSLIKMESNNASFPFSYFFEDTSEDSQRVCPCGLIIIAVLSEHKTSVIPFVQSLYIVPVKLLGIWATSSITVIFLF